jgi:hypothetical protein
MERLTPTTVYGANRDRTGDLLLTKTVADRTRRPWARQPVDGEPFCTRPDPSTPSGRPSREIAGEIVGPVRSP